jgi:hypothetical protein
MPFNCARAVCATFCYEIAGALIPIFGPNFPSECISPNESGYKRMIIQPEIVAESTLEAEMFRSEYGVAPSQRICDSISPPPPRRSMRATGPQEYPSHDQRIPVKDNSAFSSPYGTSMDTELDMYPGTEVQGNGHTYRGIPSLPTPRMAPTASASRSVGSYYHSWTAVNRPPIHPMQHSTRFNGDELCGGPRTQHRAADPVLSAIPSMYTGSQHQYQHRPPFPQPTTRRVNAGYAHRRSSRHTFEQRDIDYGYGYDGGKSQGDKSPMTRTIPDDRRAAAMRGYAPQRPGIEQDAALMLLEMRVRTGTDRNKDEGSGRRGSSGVSSPVVAVNGELQRIKKRKATSV